MGLSYLGMLIVGWAAFQASAAAAEGPPPVGWESIPERMQWEAEHGFSGVLLVAREGKVVFEKAYGMANRDKQIPMRIDTVMGIGSTPIDFTKAGILLLAERGKLKLSDRITKYFHDVPADKQAITITHLMTGRSGLPNFHDVPTDRDPDHSWIDRDEAVRRILAQKLLFPPGQGARHSHSAWGLLAAILEITSGQTYPEFTREHLFKPAGMNDTGFFGDPYPAERLAIGYGPRTDGKINAPPYWGKTSWLVMGSGGQVSTAPDMWRWVQAIYGGKILSPASLRRYGDGQGIFAGGDVYGFEIVYAGNNRSAMVLMTNTGSPQRMPGWQRLTEDFAALVLERKPSKFVLGVQLEIDDNDRVKLAVVTPDGAAAKAGLRAGDMLIKVNGKELGNRPVVTLSAATQTGEPVELEIDRDGQRSKITVKPLARQ
jgi:CubicO group peptidase (beta-lactamase class C family)